MKVKQNNNVLLIFAIVLSYISVGLSIAIAVGLGFNILGFADIYKEVLVRMVSPNVDTSSQITMSIIEQIIMVFFNGYFARFYTKGIKFKINTQQYGRMLISQGLFQLFLASFPAGLFALIAGVRMSRRKPSIVSDAGDINPYLSSYKMEAMSEAVRKLKELKEKGAISEEEYYANLNKILEN